MPTPTAPTKGLNPQPDHTPPPTGIPLWPVTLIAGEASTILGSLAWAAAGPIGVLASIGGLAVACATAAAGGRYRRAVSNRRAAAQAAGVGAAPAGRARRAASLLPGVSAGRSARAGLGRSGSPAGGSDGSKRGGRAAGLLRRATGRAGGPAAGGGGAAGKASGRRSPLAALKKRRADKAGASSAGGGSGSKKSPLGRLGRRITGRGAGDPAARTAKPKGTGAGTRGGSEKKTTPRRWIWRSGSQPKNGPKNRAAGHNREPWYLLKKPGAGKGAATTPGPRTGSKIRGAGPTTVSGRGAPVPRPAPNPKIPNVPSTPAPIAASRGTSTGGTMPQSRLGFSDLTSQCVANATRWSVGEGEMTQAATEMARELEAGIANMARALQIVSSKISSEQPLNPVLASIAQGGAQGLQRIAGMQAQWGAAFRKVHANDIQRQTSPRPGEAAWNAPRGHR